MSITKMAFDPVNGYRDATEFPDPTTESIARDRMQDIPDQLRDYINNTLIPALEGLATLASPTFTGTVTLPATTSIGTLTAAELSYVHGVTSAIQTQLNARLSDVVGDTTPQLGGELDGQEHTIGFTEKDNGNSGTSKTIDWKLSNHQKVTMTGNCTFTFIAPSKPCMLSLRIINDGTSGRTKTFPTIKWAGGSAPTWSDAANAVDILSLYYDGSAYYGQAGIAFS